MKYVAFLDILGFKEKLKKLKHNEARQFIGDFSATAYAKWRDLHLAHLKGYIVSDSFIIYSLDTSETALNELCRAVDEICKVEFSRNSILIRGAIAKGEFDKLEAREMSTLRKGLIVGQAYVDAYLLEGTVKATGIVLSEDVYQDLLNIGGFNNNLLIENTDGTKHYILRYLTLDYLLETERLQKFVQLANSSGWLPHYYNSLYFAFKKETNDKKIHQVFINLLNAVSRENPSENWREIDIFIRNAFDKSVLPNFQTRFLKFLRKKLC